jgi:membrane protein YqaA with SNARE-associated domain
MPFGADALVMYFAARDERFFWLYPLLATIVSLVAALVTFGIGRKAGEAGLDKLVAPCRLQRLRNVVRQSGAFALALPAALPPPFPLTALILTCGALQVNRYRFLSTFAAMRLIRFSIAAALARIYGPGILNALHSTIAP